MTREDGPIVETLLRLKAKAAKGEPWTADDHAAIELALERLDDVGVLAGCCVLASMRSKEYPLALEVVRKAVERNNPTRYVELSLYEALIYFNRVEIEPFRDAVISFIEQSLARRAIDLVNTIFLLGRLARMGEGRALALLQSLADDSNTEVRDSAIRVLRGLAADAS